MSTRRRAQSRSEGERAGEFAALREQGYGIPAGRREAWVEQMLTTGRTERLLGAFRDGRLVGMLNVLAFGAVVRRPGGADGRCRVGRGRAGASAGSASRRGCSPARSSSWPNAAR